MWHTAIVDKAGNDVCAHGMSRTKQQTVAQHLHLGRETKDCMFGVEEKLSVITLYSDYLNCLPRAYIHFSVKQTEYGLKYSIRDH